MDYLADLQAISIYLPRSLRRVLYRVFRLRPHRLPHHDGGVFAVRIARSYPITTVQFLVTGGFVARLWGSEVARCIRRGLFEVTAGECDELDTTSYQHGMNSDCIAEDNSNILRSL
ncbi:unnamed protein product [Penicillium nalgiovense]|uniref:Uncharacterized protein n=1 Tax=Penicillium nalgiovense TaxID=60175 RepID=A0A9W4HVH6_PENNA|nr:unnamed protein product [Penicillium nalgiovense]CAG8092914.1 unnamed protein product [Penicillium nalgiovense]CAG8101879.1 unnamed protein product [Penicillium nalgiovense]CAG8104847.1 unnamed protein product [Penicillium nalgiovense]CAG8138717.1 unnamed protein product [Penicillium nalgiovense]